MSANNQIVLIGRAGNDVAEDVKNLPSGSMVAEVRLAVNRPGKDQMGNTVTDWITCQFWNKQAEILSQYVQKGDLISVAGSMRVDNWEKDGQKRQKYFVHGENFQMLESRQSKEERRQSEGSGPAQRSTSKSQKPAPPQDNFNDEFELDDDELPPF